MSHDRIAALVVLLFALVYMLIGNQITTAFVSGIVGPREWGLGVGGMLALFSLALFVRPTPLRVAFDGKVAVFAMLPLPLGLAVYAYAMPQLGFIIATSLYIALVARQFGGTWLGSVIASLVCSVACFWLFGLLGISLPTGRLWR